MLLEVLLIGNFVFVASFWLWCLYLAAEIRRQHNATLDAILHDRGAILPGPWRKASGDQ